MNKYSSRNTIFNVAQREIAVLLRSKPLIISIAVALVLTVGGAFAASYFMNKDQENQPVLVVSGMPAHPFEQTNQAFTEANNEGAMNGAGPIAGVGFGDTNAIKVESADSPDAAKQKVSDEKADAALVASGEGKDATYQLIADGKPNAEIVAVVSATLNAHAQNEALHAVGVDPVQFAQALPAHSFNIVDISDENAKETNIGAVVTVLFAVSLMAFFIILFASNIGSRVTEEKSSRVVELMLASVRPMDFLAGKLIGVSVLGLVATSLIIGAGAATVAATGLLDDFTLDLTIIPLMLLSFVVGLLFFGSLYAAAGSMVSRTEDLQSTQGPIMLLIMAMIYAPIFGWNELDSNFMQVISWIPPLSLSVAPLEFAGGHMSLMEVIASFCVATVVTVGVLAMVAKIYRNAILHNGSKMSWRKALKTS
ncbi:ABC transporter permease [Corynebacterium sp. 4HC-13]|uniref:ABC transporter permease n=2 Tax=Corynebacterium anserum TaxID=2684406 RepID=A0A7G7YQV4_9CORY|nr:ABC transporter permease [Corynebacterium anserum]QNH96874.1 ABC transporter permease [Corynebacterium anserum]